MKTLVFTTVWHCLALFGTVRDIPLCSHTPRFSYRVLKQLFLMVPLAAGCTGMGGTGWVYRGGYTGWVYRGVLPGEYPAARGANPTSGAGPGRPAGPGVGGWGAAGVTGYGGRDGYPPPCGPGQASRGLPWGYPRRCPPRANMARFDLFLLKVSQNDEVSTLFHEKACHSPYFQNGVRLSPLDFLRFPFRAAFSHKELMVPF